MSMGVPQDSQNVSQSAQSVPTQVEARKTAPEEGGVLARTDSLRSIISDNGSEASSESLSTDHTFTKSEDLPPLHNVPLPAPPRAPDEAAETTEVLPKPDFGPPPAPAEEGSDTLEGEAAPLNNDDDDEVLFAAFDKDGEEVSGSTESPETTESDKADKAPKKGVRFDVPEKEEPANPVIKGVDKQASFSNIVKKGDYNERDLIKSFDNKLVGTYNPNAKKMFAADKAALKHINASFETSLHKVTAKVEEKKLSPEEATKSLFKTLKSAVVSENQVSEEVDREEFAAMLGSVVGFGNKQPLDEINLQAVKQDIKDYKSGEWKDGEERTIEITFIKDRNLEKVANVLDDISNDELVQEAFGNFFKEVAATSKQTQKYENVKKFAGIIKNSIQKKYESAKPALDKGQKLANRVKGSTSQTVKEIGPKITKTVRNIFRKSSNKMSDKDYDEFRGNIGQLLKKTPPKKDGEQTLNLDAKQKSNSELPILHELSKGEIGLNADGMISLYDKIIENKSQITEEQKSDLIKSLTSFTKNHKADFEKLKESDEKDKTTLSGAYDDVKTSIGTYLTAANGDYRSVFARIIAFDLDTGDYEAAAKACGIENR